MREKNTIKTTNQDDKNVILNLHLKSRGCYSQSVAFSFPFNVFINFILRRKHRFWWRINRFNI